MEVKFRKEDLENDQFIDFSMEVAPKGTCVSLYATFPDGTKEEILSFLKKIIWIQPGAKRLGIETISNLSGKEMEFYVKKDNDAPKQEGVKE